MIEEKKEMSNDFNKLFSNADKQLDSLMPHSTGNPISYVTRNMHSFLLASTFSNECRIINQDL